MTIKLYTIPIRIEILLHTMKVIGKILSLSLRVEGRGGGRVINFSKSFSWKLLSVWLFRSSTVPLFVRNTLGVIRGLHSLPSLCLAL